MKCTQQAQGGNFVLLDGCPNPTPHPTLKAKPTNESLPSQGSLAALLSQEI